MLPCVNQRLRDSVSPFKRGDHRRNLHKIRPRADNV